MSVIIKYNNEILYMAGPGETITLNTASHLLEHNLEIVVESDTPSVSDVTFTVNGATYLAQPNEYWYDWITRLGDAEAEIYETPNGTFSCAGENSGVYFNDSLLKCQETASGLEGSDVITSGYHYYTETTEPDEPDEPSVPSTDDISFWVDGNDYKVAQGTYWSEFVAQNSSTFSTDTDGVLYNGNPVYCSSNRARVTSEDPIHFEEYYANWSVFTINGIAFTFEGERPFYAITSSTPQTMPIASRLTLGSNEVYFDGNKVYYEANTAKAPTPGDTVYSGDAFLAGAAAMTGQCSFTVDGEMYTGLYGMPWYDWCRSTHNTTASDVSSRAFCYNENSQVIFGIQEGPDPLVLCLGGTQTSVNSGDDVGDSATYNLVI